MLATSLSPELGYQFAELAIVGGFVGGAMWTAFWGGCNLAFEFIEERGRRRVRIAEARARHSLHGPALYPGLSKSDRRWRISMDRASYELANG